MQQLLLLLSTAFAPARRNLNGVGCSAPRRAPSSLVLQIRPGGDLEGGLDDKRNADILALKRLFYTAGVADRDEGDPAAAPSGGDVAAIPATKAEAARRLGIYLDLPLARWSMVFLPHQQESHTSPSLALSTAPECTCTCLQL
jgi:hypothetical protein